MIYHSEMSQSILDSSQLTGHYKMLADADLSAYETYKKNQKLEQDAPKIEDWIQARISAKDGTTRSLIASPIMWNIYDEGGVFLADIRIFHPFPHEVMRVAHASV
jgi:hypothetical protein